MGDAAQVTYHLLERWAVLRADEVLQQLALTTPQVHHTLHPSLLQHPYPPEYIQVKHFTLFIRWGEPQKETKATTDKYLATQPIQTKKSTSSVGAKSSA